MNRAFFHRDGDWLIGNDPARGPWSESACHAGPVTGAIAGAAEAAVTDKVPVRLTANFLRPVPMAGFRLESRVVREGRTSALVGIELTDRDGRLCASSECLFLATAPNTLPTASVPPPSFVDSVSGQFVSDRSPHGKPFFGQFIEVRYPPGENNLPGPTTLWMKSPPIVDGEATSAFQSLCPIADCGNGISRNTELDEASCVNADLSISVFRLPESEWLASQSTSFWERNGIGASHALLFDTRGAIGVALQSLVIRPAR